MTRNLLSILALGSVMLAMPANAISAKTVAPIVRVDALMLSQAATQILSAENLSVADRESLAAPSAKTEFRKVDSDMWTPLECKQVGARMVC